MNGTCSSRCLENLSPAFIAAVDCCVSSILIILTQFTLVPIKGKPGTSGSGYTPCPTWERTDPHCTVRVKLAEAAMLELDVSAPSSVSVYVPFATSLLLEPPLSVPPQLVATPSIPIRKTQLRPARIQPPCL